MSSSDRSDSRNVLRRERGGIQLWVYLPLPHLKYVWFQRSDGTKLVDTRYPYTGKMSDLYFRFDSLDLGDLQWLSDVPVIQRDRDDPDWLRIQRILYELEKLR